MDRDSPGRNLRRAGLLGVGWSSVIGGLLGIFWKCRDRQYGLYPLIDEGIGRRIVRGLSVSLYHNQAGGRAYWIFRIQYDHKSRSSPLDQSRRIPRVERVQAKDEHLSKLLSRRCERT